mmetsp:Transcript_14854/g.20844  ORF Transcript_14854/g.20844 Transcript_14854/m.20844 type:complete len:174 (+) Transcript_14854:247-768(+)
MDIKDLKDSGGAKPQKRLLSKNTTALRFMQRGVGDGALSVDNSDNSAPQRTAVKRRITVTDSISYFDSEASEGRFSAQGFNADVEKRAKAVTRAKEKVMKHQRDAEIAETHKRQADIPDEEMAKRLRIFTKQSKPEENNDTPVDISLSIHEDNRPARDERKRKKKRKRFGNNT